MKIQKFDMSVNDVEAPSSLRVLKNLELLQQAAREFGVGLHCWAVTDLMAVMAVGGVCKKCIQFTI